MVIGLVGLLVMAIPVLGRHGHSPLVHGRAGISAHGGVHGHPHAGHALGGRGAARTSEASTEIVPADAAAMSRWRFVPSPRAMFSVLALFGAFGNALERALHLSVVPAAVVAAALALLVERVAVRPLWNLLFRFQGHPSSPFEGLIYGEARAVVEFRNGRGMVSTVRDGRLVQLAARLREDQAMMPVKVGEQLRIEDVDARHERVTVSVLSSLEKSNNVQES